METGGGHLQGALGVFLSLDVGQVAHVGGRALAVGQAGKLQGPDGRFPQQVTHQSRQGGRRIDLNTLHQGGLGSVGGGDVDGGKTLVPGHRYHGQYAVGVAQAAVQGKLPQEQGRFVGQVNLPGTEQNAHGNGQVVGRAGLLQVSGGQVDGNAAHGKLAAAVPQGGANPLPGFLYRRIGQANHVEDWQAVGNIHFYLDYEPVQAHYSAGLTLCKHRNSSGAGYAGVHW